MSTHITRLDKIPKLPVLGDGAHVTGELSIALALKHPVFVPMGISDLAGRKGNAYVSFDYCIKHSPVHSLSFEIFNQLQELVYQLDVAPEFSNPGCYQIHWDGFDLHEVFDSMQFSNQRFEARITARYEDLTKETGVHFNTGKPKVDWVDILINRRTRRMVASLRTAFTEGATESGGDLQRIPAYAIEKAGVVPLKTIKKSFEELVELALAGMRYHWGRNKHHPVAQQVRMDCNAEYEVMVSVENTTRYAIKSPKVVYQQHCKSRRSRNWELSRLLFYNTGFLRQGDRWYYHSERRSDEDFQQIAAHEIGHEILLAYGGHRYSKSHKGSSTILTQRPLGNYHYPQEGEIDLMIYYANSEECPYPADYNQRSVASEQDVLSLIWLTQCSIRPR